MGWQFQPILKLNKKSIFLEPFCLLVSQFLFGSYVLHVKKSKNRIYITVYSIYAVVFVFIVSLNYWEMTFTWENKCPARPHTWLGTRRSRWRGGGRPWRRHNTVRRSGKTSGNGAETWFCAGPPGWLRWRRTHKEWSASPQNEHPRSRRSIWSPWS